jgi:hypothetical protein
MREPKSLGEARRRKVRLELELEEINLQLGDRDRKDEDGERLHPLRYIEWRKKTKYASIEKKKELSEISFWIEDHWGGEDQRDEEEEIEEIIEALLAVIDTLAEENGGLTKAESLLVNKAKNLIGEKDGVAR